MFLSFSPSLDFSRSDYGSEARDKAIDDYIDFCQRALIGAPPQDDDEQVDHNKGVYWMDVCVTGCDGILV